MFGCTRKNMAYRSRALFIDVIFAAMFVKHFLPAFAWLIVIVVLSTRGNVPMPSFNLIGPDKLGHAAAYGVLGWLILWGFRRSSPARVLRNVHFIGTFVFAAAFGVLMEWVQLTFFPGRFYEYDDMLANAIGAAVACFLLPRIPKLSP